MLWMNKRMSDTRKRPTAGFTLMELLVVCGIVSILIGILVPTVARARNAAGAIQCAANLRQISGLLSCYALDHGNVYPPAYVFKNGIDGSGGIVSWTRLLDCGDARLFLCPSFDHGGLPPTNGPAELLEPGQIACRGDILEDQLPRVAYALNQALFPTGRFGIGVENSITASQVVKTTRIKNPSRVILATEWTTQWSIVRRPVSVADICESYLPVHGFAGMGPMSTSDRCDLNFIGNPHKCMGDYRRLDVSDLSSDPTLFAGNRLDWVGRNHGSVFSKTTNFVYADGHVETKPIAQTLSPFEWGDECYSIRDRKLEP